MWCSLPDGRTLIREELGRYQQRVPRHSPTHPTRLLATLSPKLRQRPSSQGLSARECSSTPACPSQPLDELWTNSHPSCLAASSAMAHVPDAASAHQGARQRVTGEALRDYSTCVHYLVRL